MSPNPAGGGVAIPQPSLRPWEVFQETTSLSESAFKFRNWEGGTTSPIRDAAIRAATLVTPIYLTSTSSGFMKIGGSDSLVSTWTCIEYLPAARGTYVQGWPRLQTAAGPPDES